MVTFISKEIYCFVIIDSLSSCLKTRKEAYTNHKKMYCYIYIPCLFKQPNMNLISGSCLNFANRFSSSIEKCIERCSF